MFTAILKSCHPFPTPLDIQIIKTEKSSDGDVFGLDRGVLGPDSAQELHGATWEADLGFPLTLSGSWVSNWP